MYESQYISLELSQEHQGKLSKISEENFKQKLRKPQNRSGKISIVLGENHLLIENQKES